MSMGSDAVTKREKRLAAREDRKQRAAAAQRSARIPRREERAHRK